MKAARKGGVASLVNPLTRELGWTTNPAHLREFSNRLRKIGDIKEHTKERKKRLNNPTLCRLHLRFHKIDQI